VNPSCVAATWSFWHGPLRARSTGANLYTLALQGPRHSEISSTFIERSGGSRKMARQVEGREPGFSGAAPRPLKPTEPGREKLSVVVKGLSLQRTVNRRGQSSGNRPVAEQQGREFQPGISTTRTRHVPLLAYAKFTETRCRPFLCPQPFQTGTQPLQPGHLQAKTRRRSRRMARSLRGIRDSVTVLTETGSQPSDSIAVHGLAFAAGYLFWKSDRLRGTKQRYN